MALLANDVWQMTGAQGLGKMIAGCNVALVEGPLVAAERVVDLVMKLTEKFSDVLKQWQPEKDEGQYGPAEMDKLLCAVQSALFGMVAQRQEVTAQVEIASQQSAAEHFAARLGLGYGIGGFSGELGGEYVTDTTRGVATRASYRYTAASMADDAQWQVIAGALEGAPPTLAALLGAAYRELLADEQKPLSDEVPTP